MDISRSGYYYQSVRDDSDVEDKLGELAQCKPTRGFKHYYGIIRNEGHIWNRKRVKRIYKKLHLNKRRRRKRRVFQRVIYPIQIPSMANQIWSMDFMHDALENGRKVKCFNILDDFNRECLAIECGSTITGRKVCQVIDKVIEWRGKPQRIRVDNGPEFTSVEFTRYCENHSIIINYIQPGKPVQNALIERFNRTFREDVLDAFIFKEMNDIKYQAEIFREEYNNQYPHQALKGKSPIKYLMSNGI